MTITCHFESLHGSGTVAKVHSPNEFSSPLAKAAHCKGAQPYGQSCSLASWSNSPVPGPRPEVDGEAIEKRLDQKIQATLLCIES